MGQLSRTTGQSPQRCCWTAQSELPSCICLSALAWCTCRIAWHAGQRLPDLQHFKLCPRVHPSAYRLWMGDVDHSSKWRHFAGTGTPRPLSPPGECPRTPWQPRHRGVVRTEEADEQVLAMKGAIHDFVSSSCTSGKKGTGAERDCEPRPAPRNQSSSREGLELSGLLTSRFTLGCPGKHGRQLWVRCGGGDNTEGGSPAEPLSSEGISPSPDATIDILSSGGAPN